MLKLTMSSRKRSKRSKTASQKDSRKYRQSNSVGSKEVDGEKEMTGDSLQAMLRQEGNGHYNCVDYLSMTPWQQEVYHVNKKKPIGELSRKPITSETRIDEYCREQIVEWSFRVVDYFRIDREVVALSISFLDRFLSKWRCDRTSFKLAATTTLNLAVKLLYPCKLGELGILSDLSRGEFEMADVAEMENCILRSLSWQLHPPTSIAFGTLLLDYVFVDFPFDISSSEMDDIYDVSSFFCDLAVCDYFFVPIKSSMIGIAAILNALEGMFGPDNRLDVEVRKSSKRLGVYNVQDLSGTRNRLWELYERSEECALHNKKEVEEEHKSSSGGIFVKKLSAHHSPVSISGSCVTGAEISCHNRSSANNMRNNTSW